MIIKKYQGKTEGEAVSKAKAEMGEDVVIMNVKTVKQSGLKKLFKKPYVEITAAKDEPGAVKPVQAPKPVQTAQAAFAVKSYEGANEVKSFAEVATEAGVKDSAIEERLDNLTALIEKKLYTAEASEDEKDMNRETRNLTEEKNSNIKLIKMVYNTMIDHEIDEKYANQIIDEIERMMTNDTHMDTLLSSIYQKLILKFGKPSGIKVTKGTPKVVFFIGPTGVGKTTTIAKLASRFKIDQKLNVAFLTADTYRIAAAEQLRTYADIIEAPLSVVYTTEDLNAALEQMASYDLILVDTAGYSHRNLDQQNEIKSLIDAVDAEKFEKEVYLVLSATTKYNDLKSIVDAYKDVADFRIIFTKLDETYSYGNILNIKIYTGAELSYTTNGQNVPSDVEVLNSQKIVKSLLGGRE